MAHHRLRYYGDPVLTQRARAVTEIDGSIATLCEEMIETMYAESGLGLAAPQVGIQKRLFVYDLGDGPGVLINPEIRESEGTWEFEEGCLSLPGLHFAIVRPKQVLVVGYDLEGNEVQREADELEARLYQHEMDHLDGVLLVERLDDQQRREALRALRHQELERDTSPSRGLTLR